MAMNMACFTPIDMRTYPRREHFHYFAHMAPTGYSLTAEVDVTRLRAALKTRGLKFYPAYLWLVTHALNAREAFRLAEKDGVLGVYDTLTPLYAVFHRDDETFSMQCTEFSEDFAQFYRAWSENQARDGENHGFLAQQAALPPENAYTVSCLPWVNFRHFAVHSYDCKPYYFPSVEAGRFEERDGRTILPLSITCHHAATDGWHVKGFLEQLQREADDFDSRLTGL